MAYEGNPGMNNFAKVLSSRMQRENESPLPLDFGSIQPDYSLITNTFPVPIPKSDYVVCRCVGGLSVGISGGEHTKHETGTGAHEHTASLPAIQPGNRVLVAWVQNEAVVIDVIISASSI